MSLQNGVDELLSFEGLQKGTSSQVNGEHRDSKIALLDDSSHLPKLSTDVTPVPKPEPAAVHGGPTNEPLSLDAILNGTNQNGTGSNGTSAFQSPSDFGDDPLSATAMTSSVHALDLNNAFAGRSRSHTINHGPPSLPDLLQNSKDWEIYKRAGPPYPPSLEKLIINYHKHHSNSWHLAYDLGQGSGVYASVLARYFRHVHVSDPDPAGLKVSRQLLSTWCAKEENKKRRGGFTFSVSTPEEAADSTADATVDLAILTECAHFADAEAMVRSVAQTLVPGGTLAIITHRPICSVVGNEQATQAVQALFDAWGRRPWDVACGTDARSRQQYSLGLDFVPLPEELFARDRTRRIAINTHGRARQAFIVPGVDEEPFTPGADMDFVTSRVDPQEKHVEYGEMDEQGKGWRQVVGSESFRARVALVENGDKEVQHDLESYFEEVNRVVSATSPNGHTIVVEWAVAVVLASRR